MKTSKNITLLEFDQIAACGC